LATQNPLSFLLNPLWQSHFPSLFTASKAPQTTFGTTQRFAYLTKPALHLQTPEGPTSSFARLHLGATGATGAGAGATRGLYEYDKYEDWTVIARAARAIWNFISLIFIGLATPFLI
jgi:hypothetical protein